MVSVYACKCDLLICKSIYEVGRVIEHEQLQCMRMAALRFTSVRTLKTSVCSV